MRKIPPPLPPPSVRRSSKGGCSVKKKKLIYPSKTTLNLCIKEKSPLNPGKLIPLLILVLLLAVAFCKFAVVDRIQNTNAVQSELSALRSHRDGLKTYLEDYDDVAVEFSRYSLGWMDDSERVLVKRTEMLDLVESMLMPYSRVRSVSASGNTISITLSGVTLKDTSRFVEALYARDDVDNVTVYTASTNASQTTQAAVSMVITMKHVEGGESK